MNTHELCNGSFREPKMKIHHLGPPVCRCLPTADLRFRKVDAETGCGLDCAEFALCFCGETIAVATSDKDGCVSFCGLWPGCYTLKETIPPYGYCPNNTIYQVEVTNEGEVFVDGAPACCFCVKNHKHD